MADTDKDKVRLVSFLNRVDLNFPHPWDDHKIDELLEKLRSFKKGDDQPNHLYLGLEAVMTEFESLAKERKHLRLVRLKFVKNWEALLTACDISVSPEHDAHLDQMADGKVPPKKSHAGLVALAIVAILAVLAAGYYIGRSDKVANVTKDDCESFVSSATTMEREGLKKQLPDLCKSFVDAAKAETESRVRAETAKAVDAEWREAIAEWRTRCNCK